MEKIQQALEKARHQRPTPRVESPAIAPPSPGALRVTYGPTRSVRVSRRTLLRQRVVAASPSEPAADAFRVLRTRLMARLDERRGRAVAVCAAQQGSGKTFLAANLAVSIAQYVHRSVLLVDLDLRHPTVHRCFGLEPVHGLADHLESEIPLEACLINPGIDRLVVLPQPRPITRSAELLASPRMLALAQELNRRYDDRIVIYDCPPLLTTADAIVALGYVDGCLLVVPEGGVSRGDLVRAAELIGEERFLGSVLNDARWAAASGSYAPR